MFASRPEYAEALQVAQADRHASGHDILVGVIRQTPDEADDLMRYGPGPIPVVQRNGRLFALYPSHEVDITVGGFRNHLNLPRLIHPVESDWVFMPAADAPVVYTQTPDGNLRIDATANAVTGPSRIFLDAAFSMNFRISGPYVFQLRLDVNNILNHPNWSNPDDRAPAIGLVYADRYLITDAGVNLGRFDLPEYDSSLLLHVNLVHCCFLYRRACMDRIGLYDPEFIYGEDWEYWIRMSQYYRMQHVPGALYQYRLHDTSKTSELVRGTARNLGHQEFSNRIRRRMRLRWYIGKIKWRWLRLTYPQHPAVAGRADWMQATRRAAQMSA